VLGVGGRVAGAVSRNRVEEQRAGPESVSRKCSGERD